MINPTVARILVVAYYSEDYSPTDNNVIDCYKWLLSACMTKEQAIEAIDCETGIILRDDEL